MCGTVDAALDGWFIVKFDITILCYFNGFNGTDSIRKGPQCTFQKGTKD